MLRDSPDWHVDGTFKVCPTLFYQLFTIHAVVHGQMVPCVFALLPDKKETTYRRLFEVLAHLQPKTLLMDFELAITNAAKAVFPRATIR